MVREGARRCAHTVAAPLRRRGMMILCLVVGATLLADNDITDAVQRGH